MVPLAKRATFLKLSVLVAAQAFAPMIRYLFYALVVTVACLSPLRSDAANWSTYQGDSSHTGYIPYTLNPSQFQIAWTKSFSNTSFTPGTLQPVVGGDGKVFLSVNYYFGMPEELHAYDSATGNEIWSKQFADPNPLFPGYGGIGGMSGPAYSGGQLYVHVANGSSVGSMLYSFAGATGAPGFAVQNNSQGDIYGVPTVYSAHVYEDTGLSGGVRSLGAGSGTQDWVSDLPQQHGWSPAADTGHVYAFLGQGGSIPGPVAGTLYAFNRSDGNLDYTILDPSSHNDSRGNGIDAGISTVLLGAHGDAFVVDGVNGSLGGNNLVRFDLANRSIVWETHGGYQAGIALANDKIFAVTTTGLEVRDAFSGTSLWTWSAPGGAFIVSNVLVTNTQVFVSTDRDTYAIDLQTHAISWTTHFGGKLSLADHWLYITGIGRLDNSDVNLVAVDVVVPEPSSAYLLAAGLLGLIVWRWRASKASQVPGPCPFAAWASSSR
jgi:hypothetical protein